MASNSNKRALQSEKLGSDNQVISKANEGQDASIKKSKCTPSKHRSDAVDEEEPPSSQSSENYGNIRSKPELWPTLDFSCVLHEVYHASDPSSFSGSELPHVLFVKRFTNIFINEMAKCKADMSFLKNENENLRLALKLAHQGLSESCAESSVCSGVSEELVPSSSPEGKAVDNKEDTNAEPKKTEVGIKASPAKSTGSSASTTSSNSKKSDSHESNAESGSTTEWSGNDNNE